MSSLSSNPSLSNHIDVITNRVHRIYGNATLLGAGKRAMLLHCLYLLCSFQPFIAMLSPPSESLSAALQRPLTVIVDDVKYSVKVRITLALQRFPESFTKFPPTAHCQPNNPIKCVDAGFIGEKFEMGRKSGARQPPPGARTLQRSFATIRQLASLLLKINITQTSVLKF
jgi:hypothetical protein